MSDTLAVSSGTASELPVAVSPTQTGRLLLGLGLATWMEFYTFDAVNLVLPDMAGTFGVSLDQAEARLNLSYTRIYAVRPGTGANRTVQVDNYVEPGETLFFAVPLEVYVVADFKETQLTHMHPGRPAIVCVDAYPDMQLRGHVDSFQRGMPFGDRFRGGCVI